MFAVTVFIVITLTLAPYIRARVIDTAVVVVVATTEGAWTLHLLHVLLVGAVRLLDEWGLLVLVAGVVAVLISVVLLSPGAGGILIVVSVGVQSVQSVGIHGRRAVAAVPT
jgi:hypothetical protein